MSGEFFDRRHVERRLRLVSARRARQQHAKQPRGMQSLQQRLGDTPRALDLVGRGDDLRPELAGAGERVRTGLDAHASSRIGRALRPPCVDRAPLLAVSPRRAAGGSLVNRPLRQRQPRRDICESHPHPGADTYPLDFDLRCEHPVRPHQIADHA